MRTLPVQLAQVIFGLIAVLASFGIASFGTCQEAQPPVASSEVLSLSDSPAGQKESGSPDIAMLQQRYNDLTRGFLILLQEKAIPVPDQALVREIMVRSQKMRIRERLSQLRAAYEGNRRQESLDLLLGLERDLLELADLLATFQRSVAEDQALLARLLDENQSLGENGLKNEGENPDSSTDDVNSSSEEGMEEDSQQKETGEDSGPKESDRKETNPVDRLEKILAVQKRLNTRVALYESMKAAPGADLPVIEKGLAELSEVQLQIIDLLQSTFRSEGDHP
ncbi:MAG: hypothetical protein Q4G68_05030 [Planctomycetia bacterium]|nr:hypothetical protein [Planctomycetia bacterium]